MGRTRDSTVLRGADSRRAPRYHDIATDLQSKIADGTYPVGKNLPTEAVLCRTFGVSRHTVREALKRLANRGLVERRRALGTLVRARYPEGRYRQALPSTAALLEIPRDLIADIQERGSIITDIALARTLGCVEGRPWSWFGIVRRSPEGPPVCWTDLYVCPSVLSGDGARPPAAANALLEQRCMEQAELIDVAIEARRMSARQAEVLAVDPSLAALSVVRRMLRDGEPYCVSLSLFPQSRFGFETKLARSWQPARERNRKA
ncbi:GntR family transcriptional regulator [Marinibaculum pumilum]|uniref:GntR family transcriptional regulator n=1 Tax=Marinibaculum pumilum TaxID=1766165 RepID=A0ABV7KXJ7_9PROT